MGMVSAFDRNKKNQLDKTCLAYLTLQMQRERKTACRACCMMDFQGDAQARNRC
jgi:hypothetical protein